MSHQAFETGLMWSVYNDMEGEFMRFLDHVPFTEEHMNVYSYSLLRLMLQIGGYVDTAFKEMAFYSEFDKDSRCRQIRQKVAREETITIAEFANAFQPIYYLSTHTLMVRSPKHFKLWTVDINPFVEFKKRRAPKWWKAYNRVKHNWIKNLREANLENTLEALGGALVLNAAHDPSLFQLARRAIAITFDAGWNRVRFSDDIIRKIIKGDSRENRIAVETQLFLWLSG